jgi:hypothetical protein
MTNCARPPSVSGSPLAKIVRDVIAFQLNPLARPRHTEFTDIQVYAAALAALSWAKGIVASIEAARDAGMSLLGRRGPSAEVRRAPP